MWLHHAVLEGADALEGPRMRLLVACLTGRGLGGIQDAVVHCLTDSGVGWEGTRTRCPTQIKARRN